MHVYFFLKTRSTIAFKDSLRNVQPGEKNEKKRNSSIGAYLLRSALTLLSLTAICVVPFVLAQRDTGKRVLTGKPLSRDMVGSPLPLRHDTETNTQDACAPQNPRSHFLVIPIWWREDRAAFHERI